MTHPPIRPRVLLVTNGASYMKVGGAALRYGALDAALALASETSRFSFSCPDPAGCGHPPPPDVVPLAESVRRAAPFHAACCRVAAEALLRTVHTVRPEIIVGSGLESWTYLRYVAGAVPAARILDLHNVDSPLYGEIVAATGGRPDRTHYTLDDAAAVSEIERSALEDVDRVWTCTDIDRQRLRTIHGVSADRVAVVPNTVRVGPLDPSAGAAIRHVLFLGRLDWFPNIQAAEFILDDLLPQLRSRRVRLPVTIAGAHPSVVLSQRELPDGVRLVADPPSVAPLWRGAVLAVPLQLGGGSRLKILEAFAAGCPVVSTAKGIEGIAARPGRDYLLADSPAEMAEAIAGLATDAGLRRHLATHAYRLVGRAYGATSAAATITADIRRLSAQWAGAPVPLREPA